MTARNLIKFTAALGLGLMLSSAHAALVASYSFDGNADDGSGNGNNATVNGATLTADRFGNANSAYLFDGVNDSIFTGIQRSNLSSSFSVSSWHRYDGTAGAHYQPVVASSGQTFFYGKNTGNTSIGVQLDAYNPNQAVGTNAWDGGWHHIVASFEQVGAARSMSLYLDNVLIASSDFFPGSFPGEFTIGFEQDPPGHQYFFTGAIDDVKIYDSALTSGEVSQLFNESSATVPAPAPLAIFALGLAALPRLRFRRLDAE